MRFWTTIHAATNRATVLNDSLGQRLDLVAWKAASVLKEGANTITECPIDAHELLAVLVPAVVVDLGGDLLTQALSSGQAWVASVHESVTLGRSLAVDTECSDT
jgi:hypothetical protein